MGQLKDVRVEVRVRNNLILTKMEERGIASVSALCRQMKIPTRQSVVSEIINMKRATRRENGEWIPLALLLADFFHCPPEDIFSDHQQRDKLEKNRAHAEISFAEILQLTSRQKPVTPELSLQAQELRKAVSLAMQQLSAREQRVLHLRFGFESGQPTEYGVIGKELGCTKQNVQRIELEALRKLAHPNLQSIFAPCMQTVELSPSDWESSCKKVHLDQDVLDAL